jgi:hypothetical protein
MYALTRKAAAPLILLVLLAVGLAACGSGGGDETTTTRAARPAVSRATADHLAKLSNRVASDLDAGETCSAAYAADVLKAAVESSDLPATVRPDVDRVAGDLVNQVNCPPPPLPPPAPEKKPKPSKDEQGEDSQGKGGDSGPGGDHGPGKDQGDKPGHSDHGGGFVPPGHAKIEGESG